MTGYSLKRPLAQMAALPNHLKLWLAWLLLSTLFVPLFHLDTTFFASAMVCQAANLAFRTLLMLRYGLVRLLGLSHIIFWTPMFVKFWWHYDTLVDTRVLTYAWIMMLTVAISLILDVRDYRDWRVGNRGVVGGK